MGRRAAVAAASSGLGLGSAKALAAEGAQVAICGRDQARVEDAAAEVGAACIPLVCDVSGAAGGERFVAAATEALGGIDILVTNAGGPPPGTFASTDVSAYPSAIELNLMSVVAITSLAVRQPMANLILSNTARAGATGFLKTLAREVAADGVTVNSVQPGLHWTNRVAALYPDGPGDQRMGDADDFGAIVAFLCSEQANFVTGAQVHVDGGAYQALQ